MTNYLKSILNLLRETKQKYTDKRLKYALRGFNNYTQIKYTRGNSKIGKDTLILNMGLGEQCPSAIMGLCNLAPKKLGGNGKCYDLKATRLYSSSFVFKKISQFQWLHWTSEFYTAEILRLLYKHKNIKFIRLNEGGDFWGPECVEKVRYIAKVLGDFFPEIRIYTYTHRKDLTAELLTLPDNVTISGSNFMVHNEYRVDPNIKALDKPKLARKKMTCLDNCKPCNLCKVTHGQTIIQSIH